MARSKVVEPTVRTLLQESMEFRNSDKALLLAFWEMEGLFLNQTQRQAFMNATPAESITRARRSLRAEYPGSDDVEKARFERFEEEQADHSDMKALSWLNDED